MIFHKQKSIFFHVGKAAGTSIEQMILPGTRDPYFSDRKLLYGFDRDLNIFLQHATCQTTLDLVGREIFDKYFKFTVVRNPYSRLLSAYYYLPDSHEKRYGSFREFILKLHDIVRSPGLNRGSHFISQMRYTHIDGVMVADYVGKFEDLTAATLEITQQLEISATLPELNKTQVQAYQYQTGGSPYDDEMISVMQDVYKEDFELFDYDPSPSIRKPS